jgi:hypothetical protein
MNPLASRLELGQRDAFTGIVKNDFNVHANLHVFNRAADDVAAESRPLVEIDPGRDVGNVGREAAQRLTDDFANHSEGKNFALAADLYPFEFVAGAVAANRPGAKDPRAAVLALLHHELAGFGAVPESLVDRGDFREGFSNLFFCHVTEPFRTSLGENFLRLRLPKDTLTTKFTKATKVSDISD